MLAVGKVLAACINCLAKRAYFFKYIFYFYLFIWIKVLTPGLIIIFEIKNNIQQKDGKNIVKLREKIFTCDSDASQKIITVSGKTVTSKEKYLMVIVDIKKIKKFSR